MAILPLAATVNADDSSQAVSGVNGKLSVEGGLYDDETIGLVQGSVTAPLGRRWGFQADGAAGELDGDTFRGGGGHFFTRDPNRYLLGVYGSYHRWRSIDIGRLAAEAEVYMNRLTLGGVVGWETVDVPTTFNGLTVLTRDDDHLFTELDLAWYARDNLKLSAGYHYESEESLGSVSLEYSPRAFQGSIYANGDFGDDDHTRITGGVRFYLGADRDKSLIRRHREDDPQSYNPIFPQIITAAPNIQAAVTFCPARDDFPAADFPGCTCPPGSFLEGGGPFILGEGGQSATCENPRGGF